MTVARARLRVVLFAAAAVLAVVVAGGAAATGALDGLEREALDTRFAVRGAQSPPRDIVVVAIDDVTFDELDLRWPFPRSRHAQLVDRLRTAGARVIALDIQFTERSDDPVADDALIEAVAAAPGTVLATTETTEDGRSNVFGGEEVLAGIGARSGNALLPPEPGGVLRRVPFEVGGLKSFALVVAEQASGREVSRGDLPDHPALIDFRGPPGAVTTYSYSRVLRGAVPADALRGRIVVVGPSAPSLQDVHPTSTSGEAEMSGAEIQASAVHTALRGFPLRRGPGWADALLILLLGAAGPLALARLRPAWALVSVATAGALFLAGVQAAFAAGLVVSVGGPLVALIAGALGALAVALVVGAFERQRVRDVFARFVGETVVDAVLADTGGAARLGGTTRDATVVFSDLRDFTRLAEARPPGDVIDILNRYLTAMSDVILAHGGTLVAYMGDGIMAVFGAPLEQPDHADRAFAAVREMTGTALGEVNDWLAREHGLPPLEMGVGMNSGPVLSGNVGSERRMEYTCIGDATNTAARLEAMTKGTGWSVYVGEAVRERLTGGAEELVRVDELEVRGRKARIVVWAMGRRPGG